ncbi:IS630 family transposase [Methylobacterium sp. ID0610]|uniref:IS630 family transposase n=1 Tax=Methylobacterium carpenticola TaxID=3344827 RepID=UPI0036C15EAC
MSSALSVDLRQRVVHAVEAGASRHQAAERFGVSLASASRWCGQFAREGHVAPKPMGGDQRSHRIEAQADLILSLYEAKPGIYLHEFRAALAEHGVGVAQSSLSRFFKRHGISPKKSTGHAAEQERPDVRAAREAWFEGQLDLDPDRLVFIDETAASTAMARRYGRAPRGERCRMSVPRGHWKTTTITAGLRTSGITAPWLLDGAMNGQAFRTYVADVLAPTLQPGDTVVMDNLPAHKVSGVRERIEAAGAQLLYLPAYSPDFNPIELAFAKLKALLRSAAARTIPDLWDAIRRSLQRFARAECRAYFAAAGYDAT